MEYILHICQPEKNPHLLLKSFPRKLELTKAFEVPTLFILKKYKHVNGNFFWKNNSGFLRREISIIITNKESVFLLRGTKTYFILLKALTIFKFILTLFLATLGFAAGKNV